MPAFSGEDAVRSCSVRGDRTSPFTVGEKRLVCGVPFDHQIEAIGTCCQFVVLESMA